MRVTACVLVVDITLPLCAREVCLACEPEIVCTTLTYGFAIIFAHRHARQTNTAHIGVTALGHTAPICLATHALVLRAPCYKTAHALPVNAAPKLRMLSLSMQHLAQNPQAHLARALVDLRLCHCLIVPWHSVAVKLRTQNIGGGSHDWDLEAQRLAARQNDFEDFAAKLNTTLWGWHVLLIARLALRFRTDFLGLSNGLYQRCWAHGGLLWVHKICHVYIQCAHEAILLTDRQDVVAPKSARCFVIDHAPPKHRASTLPSSLCV